MKKIFFITGNKGKVLEAREKLQPLGFSVIQKDLGYPEIQADTLEEVAVWGASHVQHRYPHPFILEDAGLFIEGLQGFPGVYSKYVYLTIGLDRILQLLKGIENRKALFRSVYAYSKPGKKTMVFIGECKGMISTEKKGTHGFGFDPIFIPNGSKSTFGEMQVEEKNHYSHRARALDNLMNFLQTAP